MKDNHHLLNPFYTGFLLRDSIPSSPFAHHPSPFALRDACSVGGVGALGGRRVYGAGCIGGVVGVGGRGGSGGVVHGWRRRQCECRTYVLMCGGVTIRRGERASKYTGVDQSIQQHITMNLPLRTSQKIVQGVKLIPKHLF